MAITIESLGEFLAQNPPRSVPEEIRKRICSGFLGRGSLLFGFAFGGFALPFLYFFFPWGWHIDLRLALSETQKTTAKIVGNDRTRMNIGGSRGRSGTPVYEVSFTFSPTGGEPIRSVGYTTGDRFTVGRWTNVEYAKGNPQVCRLQNARTSMVGAFGLFVLIFPLVGFGMVYFVYRGRRRKMELLQLGAFASGRVVDVVRTNVQVNNQYRHKVNVAFEVDGMEQSSTYNAYGADVKLAEGKRDSGEPVGVLYDPKDPSRVLLADALLG
ncbi:MAG: DUF3592 domain-containing protein [Planctomycetota bacterium]|jgi:hypothetical protein